MKYIRLFNTIIILSCCCSYINALEIDREADFLAKDKEKALSIIKYKQVKENQDEINNKQLIELEKQKKLKVELEKKEKQRKAKEKKYQKQLELEKKENEKQIKDKNLRRLQYELDEKTKRIRYKIVRVFDKDRVNLNLNEGKYYVDNYSQYGIEETIPTPPVDRSNIVADDVYARLLVTTSISSRRAGTFVAMLEKNIYSPDDDKILIPKGSKFICNFEPLSRYGETSISSTCTEINLPNGRKILIDAPVYDQMGRIGMVGTLDNKNWQKYGQTAILSILGGLGSYLAHNSKAKDDVKNFANYTALNIMNLSSQILTSTVDLAPVVTVPSGTRILVRIPTTINLN